MRETPCETAMKTLIYHNHRCGTSRNTLAMIKASGETPEVIEYLRTPPSRERLVELIAMMKMTPRDLLRRKGTPFDELGLDHPALTDEQLIDAMLANPILINRPVAVTDRGARLCRPSERVLDLPGRWMRMVTIPNQSSVPKACNEFDEAGRTRMSPLYLRVVDVCEELVEFTWMMRGREGYLTRRYSERVESAAEVSRRVNQSAH